MEYLIIFGLGLALTLFLTPLARRIAFNWRIIDHPGERKIHQKPMPLTGGLVIFVSLMTSLLNFLPKTRGLWGALLFAFAFVLFGLIDDAGIKIRARNKIWMHLLLSLLFIYFSGAQFNFFKNDWLNMILTACFITFMTNSMNMLDGMDGLVGGITFFCSGFFALLAINSGQREILMAALVLMGATLGFLKYNFNPATIFLGESGSTLLGFALAIFAIKINIYSLWGVAFAMGIERLQFISFIIPLIILGIPVFDTYFVFINRFMHHIKFSQPGKDHSHHRIHLMGFSQKATVLTLYAIQIILGLIALAMVRADLQQFFALLSIVVVFFVVFTVFLSRSEVYSS